MTGLDWFPPHSEALAFMADVDSSLKRIALALEERNREAMRHHRDIEDALSRIERAAKR